MPLRLKVVEEFVFTSNKGLSKQFSYCLPGMDNLRKLKGDICNEESFIFPEHDFFGVDTKTFLQLPEEKEIATICKVSSIFTPVAPTNLSTLLAL